MLFNDKKIISKLDVIKQQGTLIGMGFSFLFYKSIERYFMIDDNETQIYYVHFLLVIVQIITILFLYKSFKFKRHQNQ